MVSVNENKSWWERYDWDESGDEWSRPRGGVEAQWFGSLFPLVRHPFDRSTLAVHGADQS